MSESGPIRLKIQGELKDLAFFHGEKEIQLPESGTETELSLIIDSPGRQKFTFGGLKNNGLDGISLELLDDAGKVQAIDLKDF